MIFENRSSLDLREFRRVFWRRKLVVFVPMVVTVVVGLVGVFFMKPQYSSMATLAANSPAPLTRTVATAAGERGRNDREGIRIIRKRILSSSFLESVTMRIGLHENPRIRARAQRQASEHPGHDPEDLLMRECVGTLTRMLDIRNEGGDIYYVRAVSSSPDLCFRVAHTVADLYIQSNRESKLRQSEQAHTFALEQMTIYEAKLEEKRLELRGNEQRRALKPLSSSPITAENVNRVNALRVEADTNVEFLKARLADMKSQLVGRGLQGLGSTMGEDASQARALATTMLELEGHQALVLVEYTEEDPAVLSGRNQIAVKSQQALAELERLCLERHPALLEESRRLIVDAEFTRFGVAAAEERSRKFGEFLKWYASDLASIPAEELRVNRLTEEVASANRLYQTWLEQATTMQIAKAVQSAKVGNQLVLIEPAQIPLAPFAPEKKKIMVLAAIMGVILGLAGAVAMEYLDMTLKSVAEIELVLSMPVIGAVPRMQSAIRRDLMLKRRRRLRVILPVVIIGAVVVLTVAYLYLVRLRAVG